MATRKGGAANFWRIAVAAASPAEPLLVVTGFLAGALLGAVADYRLVTRFLARLDNEE